APANNQTHLCAWRMAIEVLIRKEPSRLVPRAKMLQLNRAALAACDDHDGVKDGLLTDPRTCRFDPSTLLCRGAERDDCLTAAHPETVKAMYAPARKINGELIYPGLVFGGEADWPISVTASGDPGAIDLGMFRYVAHQDPAWDWRAFDLDRDVALV